MKEPFQVGQSQCSFDDQISKLTGVIVSLSSFLNFK